MASALRHGQRLLARGLPPPRAPLRGLQRAGAPPRTDYFALADVEPRFDLDLPALHERYKASMVAIHPDKLASRPPSEQRALASKAAALTQAVGVLRDPAQRAKHLLALRGRPLGEESTGDVLGSGFLARMLEAREAVEEAGSEAELGRLLEENERLVQALSADLAGAFQGGDLDEATRLTGRLQYLQRIGAEIRQRQEVQ